MRYIIILSFCLFCFDSKSQNKNNLVDTTRFELDTSIVQNNCKFYFWKGTSDVTINKLCIERICLSQDTIIFDKYIHNGSYAISDMNDDGFADFITLYHNKDNIHFFDSKINGFEDSTLLMPSEVTKIDKKGNIYCGFNEAMYGEKYSYSILYKFKETTPIFYYKLVFVTTIEGFEPMDKVKQIKLYKFQDNDYSKPVFIENIKTSNPRNFDYESYWKAHLNTFIGSR